MNFKAGSPTIVAAVNDCSIGKACTNISFCCVGRHHIPSFPEIRSPAHHHYHYHDYHYTMMSIAIIAIPLPLFLKHKDAGTRQYKQADGKKDGCVSLPPHLPIKQQDLIFPQVK